VRDVADDVEPADPFLFEEGDGVGLRLGEHRHQHVGPGRLLLAGAEDVVHRPLDHARERQRRLSPLAVLLRQRFDLAFEKSLELLAEPSHRAAAVLDDVGGLLVAEQREQEVLERGELVPATGRVVERPADGGL